MTSTHITYLSCMCVFFEVLYLLVMLFSIDAMLRCYCLYLHKYPIISPRSGQGFCKYLTRVYDNSGCNCLRSLEETFVLCSDQIFSQLQRNRRLNYPLKQSNPCLPQFSIYSVLWYNMETCIPGIIEHNSRTTCQQNIAVRQSVYVKKLNCSHYLYICITYC